MSSELCILDLRGSISWGEEVPWANGVLVRDLDLRTAGMAKRTTADWSDALREKGGSFDTYHACYLGFLATDRAYTVTCVAPRVGGWVAGGRKKRFAGELAKIDRRLPVLITSPTRHPEKVS